MKNEVMTVERGMEVSVKRFSGRKVASLFMVLCMVLSMAVVASADEVTQTIVDSSAYQDIFDILTAQLNVQSIVGVIAAILGVCVGLVFLWWGARKALGMLMAAFKKGRVSI